MLVASYSDSGGWPRGAGGGGGGGGGGSALAVHIRTGLVVWDFPVPAAGRRLQTNRRHTGPSQATCPCAVRTANNRPGHAHSQSAIPLPLSREGDEPDDREAQGGLRRPRRVGRPRGPAGMPSAARLRTGLRSPRTRPPRARVLAGARSIRTSFWRHSASRSDSHNRQTGLAPSALPGSAGPDWRRQGLDSSTPALGTRSAALATQSFQTCPSGSGIRRAGITLPPTAPILRPYCASVSIHSAQVQKGRVYAHRRGLLDPPSTKMTIRVSGQREMESSHLQHCGPPGSAIPSLSHMNMLPRALSNAFLPRTQSPKRRQMCRIAAPQGGIIHSVVYDTIRQNSSSQAQYNIVHCTTRRTTK